MTVLIPLESKIGFSNNVSVTDFNILSNANIVDPHGERISIQSTSANDSLLGSGIQKVLIKYFDTNWILNTEIISMNGTTSVLTVATDVLRIENFDAFQLGSSKSAVGTITLTNESRTNIFSQIDRTYCRSMVALHYVPPGKIVTITDIIANCPSSQGITFQMCTTKDNTSIGGGLVFYPQVSFLLAANVAHIHLDQCELVPSAFPIVCDATSSAQALPIGIQVKGLEIGQTGVASFHYIET